MALLAEAHQFVTLFLLIASVLGLAYLAIAVFATLAFARRPHLAPPASAFAPKITILKPVCGPEEGLYDCLSSFCNQDYPGEYEVIFCLHHADDPASDVIEQVIADHPGCDARIAAGDNPIHRNPKIANLSKGAAAARGEIVVIADSDILVDPSYLGAIAASFTRQAVGAVTCLYRGIPRKNLIARLGAAYVEAQFAPSVLVTLTFGTLRFCLGATMAVRSSVLAAIGGIDALGPFLADDNKLGELVAAHGHEVELSRYVVATTINEATLAQLWSHELRWARTSFVLAPVGYAFSFVMYALPLALCYLAVSADLALGGALVAAALALRVGLHYSSRAALDITRPATPWIVVSRDFLSIAEWFVSLFGRNVRWRATNVTVARDGQLAG